jgi:hypothetical protein
MKDELKSAQLFQDCIEAQFAFDRAAETYREAFRAYERAQSIKNAAQDAVAAQLAEVDRLCMQITRAGETAPDLIENTALAKVLRETRELGSIHAARETCTAGPRSRA